MRKPVSSLEVQRMWCGTADTGMGLDLESLEAVPGKSMQLELTGNPKGPREVEGHIQSGRSPCRGSFSVPAILGSLSLNP